MMSALSQGIFQVTPNYLQVQIIWLSLLVPVDRSISLEIDILSTCLGF